MTPSPCHRCGAPVLPLPSTWRFGHIDGCLRTRVVGPEGRRLKFTANNLARSHLWWLSRANGTADIHLEPLILHRAGLTPVAPDTLGALTAAPIGIAADGTIWWHQRYAVESMVTLLIDTGRVWLEYGGHLEAPDG